jgi:hypothetical protein
LRYRHPERFGEDWAMAKVDPLNAAFPPAGRVAVDPDQTRTTAPFPTSPSFLDRCRRLLAAEIDLLEPSTVVCLGRPAAEMLATVATGLESWTPWPGFDSIIPALQLVTTCELNDTKFTSAAVRHPPQCSATRHGKATPTPSQPPPTQQTTVLVHRLRCSTEP